MLIVIQKSSKSNHQPSICLIKRKILKSVLLLTLHRTGRCKVQYLKVVSCMRYRQKYKIGTFQRTSRQEGKKCFKTVVPSTVQTKCYSMIIFDRTGITYSEYWWDWFYPNSHGLNWIAAIEHFGMLGICLKWCDFADSFHMRCSFIKIKNQKFMPGTLAWLASGEIR